MPLLDHFHPPLSRQRDWQGFYIGWSTNIVTALNVWLPDGYHAAPVAAFDAPPITVGQHDPDEPDGSASWKPPPAHGSMPASRIGELVEVHVFRPSYYSSPVAAVMLVCPSNKAPSGRRAFATLAACHIHLSHGLVVVDVVTSFAGNLHDDIIGPFASTAPASSGRHLCAAAYQPLAGRDVSELRVWDYELNVGRTLPTVPLWLDGGVCGPLNLEDTYEQTRRGLRYPAAP